ncbi:hypothetical protein L21_1692 [Methanoculleus chikugoensis]|uniref:Uncharacterized protein n=1 Tax=Methanoculleus chikugoensis TaxID=118126 RepID=A0A1M4MLV6_9EURY|nr:hypothetical protein [Methanoculleus chikugoensis]NMA10301.1 hypothetical protein [Methanomicrobiales archaeon]SCL75778.1 hypothetical protein L21_1692 [Methanoculleus chikugoensis]
MERTDPHEEDIRVVEEFKREHRDNIDKYWTEVISYIKWTSTISFGASLWIGTNINSFGNIIAKTLILLSSGLLLLSVILALFVAYSSVTARSIDLIPYNEFFKRCYPSLMGDFPINKGDRPKDYKSAILGMRNPLHDESYLDKYIKWHLIAMTLGIGLFFDGMLLATIPDEKIQLLLNGIANFIL